MLQQTKHLGLTMSYFHYQNIQAVYVHGSDCTTFLQGQLSNDLGKLSPSNRLQLNALCNQKGRVIGLFFSYYLNDNALILALPTNHTDNILTALRKYAVFSKISFEPTADYHLIYSNTDTILAQSTSLYQHAIIDQALLENITKNQNPLSYLDVQKQNICQQLPWIDAENSERFLPLELNLDQWRAVSYDKGCFMGQEIIARMKYRGNLKKRLLSIMLEFALPKTDKLHNPAQKVIAEVVNQVTIDDKTYILAVFNHLVDDNSIVLADNFIASIIA